MFRNDDEAARARADALQRDLDDATDELAATKAQLAAAEAEKLRLARAVEEARRAPPKPPEPVVQTPSHHASGARAFAYLAVIVVGVSLVALVAARDERASEPPNPTCTLASDPPGARVVQYCHDPIAEHMNRYRAEKGLPLVAPLELPTVRGHTPLAKDRMTWVMEGASCDGPYGLQLDGYEELRTFSPTEGLGCDDTVHRLKPLSK